MEDHVPDDPPLVRFPRVNERTPKLTITMPPFRATASSISSLMFRGLSTKARADEWEAMKGARVAFKASQNVSSEAWETSTIIPRRFISRTTSRPNSVSPPWRGSSLEESAQPLVLLHVSVMYLTPRPRNWRRLTKSSSIACPPSSPMSTAILPPREILRTSSAEIASSRSLLWRRICSSRASIISNARPFVPPGAFAYRGWANMEKNCASTPPALSRSRSVSVRN